jgi:hypothetical protein
MVSSDHPLPGPQRLLAALEAAGFSRYSTRPGLTVRMMWPPGITGAASIVVPLDPDAPYYPAMARAVLTVLDQAVTAGVAAHTAVQALYPDAATLPEASGRRQAYAEIRDALTAALEDTRGQPPTPERTGYVAGLARARRLAADLHRAALDLEESLVIDAVRR